MATISPAELFTTQQLYALFKELDYFNQEFLTPISIRQSLMRLDKLVTEEKIRLIMEQSLQDTEGGPVEMNFDQFEHAMMLERVFKLPEGDEELVLI